MGEVPGVSGAAVVLVEAHGGHAELGHVGDAHQHRARRPQRRNRRAVKLLHWPAQRTVPSIRMTASGRSTHP